MLIFAEGWSVGRDGPGQRLIVHLKGCNMRCPWCANPEGISPRPEILFHPKRGGGAGDAACPRGALKGSALDRSLCESCEPRRCVETWRDRRFEKAGWELSAQSLLEKAVSARHLFINGGGVTFGGGEPTLQGEELIEAARLLKAEGIGTAMESNASTKAFLQAAKEIDHLICDLKAVGEKRHRQATGIGNKEVLRNLREAAASANDMLLRVPLITGFNDSQEELGLMAAFAEELATERREALGKSLKMEILRMHHMGEPKREALGESYPLSGVEGPSAELAESFKNALRDLGIECVTT